MAQKQIKNNKNTNYEAKPIKKEVAIEEVKPESIVEVVEEVSNKKSYEDLENEISEMKEMMKFLMESKKEVVEEIPVKSNIQEIIQDDYVDILPNKRITIISLYDGILALTTERHGRGKHYVFRKFGEVKNIIYSDLVEILHCHRSFAERGFFYICDKHVVSNTGLHEVYERILNKDQIDNLLNMKTIDIKNMFSNAIDEQKDIVVALITSKIRKGEDVDLNKIDVISRLYGKNIADIVKESTFREDEQEE